MIQNLFRWSTLAANTTTQKTKNKKSTSKIPVKLKVKFDTKLPKFTNMFNLSVPDEPGSPLAKTLPDASTKRKTQDKYDIISNDVNGKLNGEMISNIYRINQSMGDYEMNIKNDVFEKSGVEVHIRRESNTID